jgi:Ca-activated chloride channel family protein
VLPPTTVRQDALGAIRRLTTAGATSLGQGLFTSLGAIAGKPLTIDPEQLGREDADIDVGYFGSASIVLLTDGENTSEPDPLDIAEIASTAGVRVHSVGLGSPEGTVVEVDGFNVATALDEELLKEIAELTDGTYSAAADAETLEDVYSSIDLELERVDEPREVTALFAAGGGVLLALGAVLSLAWFGRVI